jgi:hypothetical protein
MEWDNPSMRDRRGTYAAYSIGCAVVWAVLLAIVAAKGETAKLRTITLVCCGWWIGWTSTTIARHLYPPPKTRPSWAQHPAG